MREELGIKSGIAPNLGNIGNVYSDQGDYPKALEYYFKALKMSEELGDRSHVAACLGNIGSVYSDQADYSKALEYFFKALKISEELGNKSHVTAWLGNIGNVYGNQGDSAFTVSREMRDLALADTYPKALEYYFKALKIAEEIGDKNRLTIWLGNIGSLYTKTKKYKEAEQYLLRALELCASIGALNLTMKFENMISNLYDTLGNYKMALEHYKAYSITKDSLFNEEKAKDLGKLEAKHELETAEQERLRIENERRVLLAEAQRRRDNLQYSGILIFLVILGAGLLALGKFSIPIRLAEGMIFFSFLLFFEFTLVLLDPYIEHYSSGAPAIKLSFNAVLAGFIFPLHSFFEGRLKKRISK